MKNKTTISARPAYKPMKSALILVIVLQLSTACKKEICTEFNMPKCSDKVEEAGEYDPSTCNGFITSWFYIPEKGKCEEKHHTACGTGPSGLGFYYRKDCEQCRCNEE